MWGNLGPFKLMRVRRSGHGRPEEAEASVLTAGSQTLAKVSGFYNKVRQL